VVIFDQREAKTDYWCWKKCQACWLFDGLV